MLTNYFWYGGEPAYPPLLMFKVLLLQRWYALSDPAMEEALYDRLSFRAFCGLALGDETPDHSTMHRFRDRLERHGVLQPLFDAVMAQLDRRGLVVREGTLIDATLVVSAAARPPMGRAPGEPAPRTSPVDLDARFGTNNERRRFQFGYKLHAAVDAPSGLVRALVLTPAHVQEIDLAVQLVQGDEGMVYADRGYDAARLHDHLACLGIGDGVMRRGHRGRPLSAAAQQRNHALAVKRRAVEKLFGTLKRSYRLARMSAYSLKRNSAAVMLACLAFNLRRAERLLAG